MTVKPFPVSWIRPNDFSEPGLGGRLPVGGSASLDPRSWRPGQGRPLLVAGLGGARAAFHCRGREGHFQQDQVFSELTRIVEMVLPRVQVHKPG